MRSIRLVPIGTGDILKLVPVTMVIGLPFGLVLTSPWGIAGGQYWTVVLIASCVCVGWSLAQLSRTPLSLVAAPVLAVLMVAVILGVKLIRWPSAPLVGDGFEIVVAIYAGAGALGALLGLMRPVRWLRSVAKIRRMGMTRRRV
jgi:hypothetical protein